MRVVRASAALIAVGCHASGAWAWVAPPRLRPRRSAMRCGASLQGVSGEPRPPLAVVDPEECQAEDASGKRNSKRYKRVRQHVNPLAAKYQSPAALSGSWVSDLFEDPARPFLVDIGAAKGRFCMRLGQQRPAYNVLGLEIRGLVAEKAQDDAVRLGLSNVGFINCNANVDLARILHDVNAHSRVERLHVQFPDPHFKAKHHKRRVVQDDLIETIAMHTSPPCDVFLQGDVFDVVEEMRLLFRAHPGFKDTHADLDEWMQDANPTNISTEREIATQRQGLPVFRCLLDRV